MIPLTKTAATHTPRSGNTSKTQKAETAMNLVSTIKSKLPVLTGKVKRAAATAALMATLGGGALLLSAAPAEAHWEYRTVMVQPSTTVFDPVIGDWIVYPARYATQSVWVPDVIYAP
jgi:hypothetical protein